MAEVLDNLGYQDKVQITRDLIFEHKNKKLLFGFSGGKDSTVLVDMAVDVLGPGCVDVVFSDTKLEFPETYDYISKMMEYWGIPEDNLYRTKPVRSFFKELGYCNGDLHLLAKLRGCCYALKKIPLMKLMKREGFEVAVNGVRREESTRRKEYKDYFIHFKNSKVEYDLLQPLLDWTAADIYKYIEGRGLPINPIYSMGYLNCGCSICPCPNKSYDYYSLLRKNHPRYYNLIKRYAKTKYLYLHEFKD